MAEGQRSNFTVQVYGQGGEPTEAVVSSAARTFAEFTSRPNLAQLKRKFGERLGCDPELLVIVVAEDKSEPNPNAPGLSPTPAAGQAVKLMGNMAVEWKRIAQLAVPAVAEAVSLRFCSGGVEAEKDLARNSILARLEGGGWSIRQGIELIWGGERDLDVVSSGCDEQDRALLGHVLSLVVESPDELLHDPALQDEIRRKKALLQRVLTEEDPLWRAVARAATQPPGQSEVRCLEAYVLGTVVPRGLQVSDGVSRILRGDRNEASLTATTDLIDSGCLRKVLEYIQKLESGALEASSFPTVASLTAPNDSTRRFIAANQTEFTALATARSQDDREELRPLLQRWESWNWSLSQPVERMWAGERRELRLVSEVDPNSAHVVKAILERFTALSPAEGIPPHVGVTKAPPPAYPVAAASTGTRGGGGAAAAERRAAVEATTEERWATLDRFAVKERSQRLKQHMQLVTGSSAAVTLADFDVVRLLATGANAFVYLASCRPGGKLSGHTDTLVALKVLHRYKQPSAAGGGGGGAGDDVALTATVSLQERSFRASVAKEARDPLGGEFRDNLVHVLGTFWDDASQLTEYAQLDPAQEFMSPHTAFIVLPLFAGHDMQWLLRKLRREGGRMTEEILLGYLLQMLDAVAKLVRGETAHRDLKCDNIVFTGEQRDLALADWGEVSTLRVKFTKGATSPGGAAGNLAPEIHQAISAAADGETITLDYSKNDVFAIGLIAYKMALTDADAEPWEPGVPQVRALLKPLPGTLSAPLRDLVETGLLHPSFGERMGAEVAYEAALRLQFGGGGAAAAPTTPSLPVAAAVASPHVRWEWREGSGSGDQWRAYDEAICRQLEAARLAGEQHCYFDHERYADLQAMKQHRWDEPQRCRRIRRNAGGATPQ